MSKLHIDIPKGKMKPKSIHHGRRSLNQSFFTISTVDSKDLLPDYLTPSKCKHGSSTRRTSQSKWPGLINPEPWRIPGSSYSADQQSRRRLSESIVPKRYQHIAGKVDTGLKSTGKQNTIAKATSKKRIEEHVQEKILHVVEQKAESQGNEATDSSSSNKESFEKEVINEIEVGNQNCDANATKKSLREIPLIPQSVEAKQDSHERCYISVIEDTTHNLVWVNKNKVKALVNAYECAISLNNSQPWK